VIVSLKFLSLQTVFNESMTCFCLAF
jgi:hypothetical protein